MFRIASLQLVFDVLARDNASGTFNNVGNAADSSSAKLGKLAAGAAAAGAALGGAAALADAFFETLDNEKALDKLSARLGLTAKESEEAGRVAGALYRDAYGESMADVSLAIDAVVSSIGGMRDATEADLQAVTGTAMDFASAFDVDVTEAAQTAGQLITNGFAKDATEAFDLLTASFQQIPAAMREELPDILNEYGTNFRALGFDGQEAFALLVGAAEGGSIALDKTGDALKEFSILATNLGDTGDTYVQLGLDAQKMASDILAGGDTAQAAMEKIATSILKIEDPVARATAAIDFFGTPLEDLSVDQIPAFLTSLIDAGDGLEGVEGSAARMSATLNDNLSTALTTIQREAKGFVTDALGALVTGFMDGKSSGEGLIGVMSGLGAAIGDVAGIVGPIIGVLGDFVGFLASIPDPVWLGVAAMGAFILLKGPLVALFDTIALKALYAAGAVGSVGLAGAASGLVAFLGGPWGIAIGAATIGLGFLASALMSSGDATDETSELTAQAAAAQKSFADAIKESSGLITDNLRLTAAKTAQDAGLLDIVEKTGRSTVDLTDALLGNKDAYDNIRAGLEQYITQQTLLSVGTGEGAQKHRANADAARAQLGVLDNLVGTYPSAVAAQQQLTTAVTGSTDTTATYEAQLQATADAAKDVQDETNLLKSALDALTGANVSVDEATSAYYSALDQAKTSLGDLSGEVVANNGLLNLQSERGREVADRLTTLADNSNGYVAALKAQGGSQADVAALDAQLRDSFFQTARQMTGNDDTARLLTDRYYGIPNERHTVVTADTQPAINSLDALVRTWDGRTVTLTAAARIAGGATINSLGLAFGGLVPGSSPHKRADDVLVAATAGEFMHDVDAVDYYGVGFMEALNRRQIPRDQLQYLAFGGPVLGPGLRVKAGLDTGPAEGELERYYSRIAAAMRESQGVAGSGALGGAWGSIWQYVKSRVPQARINSTYRPGDPGYHGRGKAIDFGFGSGPGGAGSAGLALINRVLHDGVGRNLAELIYDGLGDDRPDLKNGRPLTYSAGTRAEHRNHVHAAVYENGTNYVPQTGYAVVHRGEAIVPASQNQGAPFAPSHVTLQLDRDAVTDLLDGRVVTALTVLSDRGQYNG